MGPQEWLLLLVLLAILSFVLVASLRWYPHYPLVAGQLDAEAQLKATELLREVLSEAEYRHLERFGYLTVPSPGVPERIYHIPSRPGMVAVYQSGKLVKKLCLQPVEPLTSGRRCADAQVDDRGERGGVPADGERSSRRRCSGMAGMEQVGITVRSYSLKGVPPTFIHLLVG